MAANSDPQGNPLFRAITDAIGDISKEASINPVTTTSFMSSGSLTTEMQRKLINEGLLSSGL
ncbi:MAG: hypothetical protein WA869_22675 [Alloacidobacterium sp.]